MSSDSSFIENLVQKEEEEEEEEYASADDENDGEFKPKATPKSDDEETVTEEEDDEDDNTYSTESIIKMKVKNGDVEVLYKSNNRTKTMPLSKARIEKTQDVISYFERHIQIPSI